MKQQNPPETFEVRTTYDEAAYTALVRLMMKKLRRRPRIMLIFTGALSIIGSGYFILSTNEISALALFFLLLGNSMCIVGAFAHELAVRMMVASNKKGVQVQNTYLFNEEGIEIQSADTVKNLPWHGVERVFETSEYLFFFLTGGQVYLMRCVEVVTGDYAQLRAFIDKKLMLVRQEQKKGI